MDSGTKAALRLLLYLPQAHWRVPFAYQRRHTFALPPYATVIGFICNALGIRNWWQEGTPCQCQHCCAPPDKPEAADDASSAEPAILEGEDRRSWDNGESLQAENAHLWVNAWLYHSLYHSLELAIAGTFRDKTAEYTWLRNLHRDSHKTRFGSLKNRTIDHTVEHPGGQSPSRIDVLNEVRLAIYISTTSRCHCLLSLLEYALNNDGSLQGFAFLHVCEDSSCLARPFHQFPLLAEALQQQRRLSHFHLGRAEDWIVPEDIRQVELQQQPWGGSIAAFQWIPESTVVSSQVAGLFYRVPSFYVLHNQRRVFHTVNAYLNDGKIHSKYWIQWVDPFNENATDRRHGSVEEFFSHLLYRKNGNVFPVALAQVGSRQ